MRCLSMCLSLTVLLALAVSSHATVTFDQQENSEDVQNILRQILTMQTNTKQSHSNEGRTLKGFSWNDCGSDSDPAKVTKLTISPDPLHIPGNITVGFSAFSKIDIATPLAVSLEIQKKMFFWVTIPCVDNIGSCDYDDLCSMLVNIDCPAEFTKHGIPCRCPAKAGQYSLPPSTVEVNPIGIPSWLEDGSYRITAKVTRSGKPIICMHLEIELN